MQPVTKAIAFVRYSLIVTLTTAISIWKGTSITMRALIN